MPGKTMNGSGHCYNRTDLLVLDQLLSSREANEYVSGESIAMKLDMSRAAVWKSVENLRREDFYIESASSKGYRIVELPDKLLPPLISRELDTDRFGRDIRYFEEVSSTNRIARELAGDLCDGALVLAERQTGGRGRLTRSWSSPPGGIYMSLFLKPPLNVEETGGITIAMGEAIARALHDASGVETMIKWPNDIYVADRKICGILTLMDGDMDRVKWLIVGIGINVNIGPEHFTEAGLPDAGSLLTCTGMKLDRSKILSRTLGYMESNYSVFLKGGLGEIIERVRRMDMLNGKKITITTPRKVINGVAAGIDDAGRLLMETPDGACEHVFSGDVSVRKIFQ